MEEEKKEIVEKEVKDENYFKLKKSNNRKKALIVILIFTLVLACILVFVLLCQKKEEPKKEDNKQQEQKEESKEETKSLSHIYEDGKHRKLVSLTTCADSTESYNENRVEFKNASLNVVNECEGLFYINGKVVANGEGVSLASYEFFDDYILLFIQTTSGSIIEIYDGKDNYNVMSIGIVGGYVPNSYTSSENGLLIIGRNMADQYGVDNPGTEYAKIKVEYDTGTFISPEIVEKYN